jgi:hypothetical protein
VNDRLAAAKRDDVQRVDALIKQTEFADYARYFVSSFSPVPEATEDFGVVYTQWLRENVFLLSLFSQSAPGSNLCLAASSGIRL